LPLQLATFARASRHDPPLGFRASASSKIRDQEESGDPSGVFQMRKASLLEEGAISFGLYGGSQRKFLTGLSYLQFGYLGLLEQRIGSVGALELRLPSVCYYA